VACRENYSTGVSRQKKGDRRQETGDRRHQTSDRSQETGAGDRRCAREKKACEHQRGELALSHVRAGGCPVSCKKGKAWGGGGCVAGLTGTVMLRRQRARPEGHQQVPPEREHLQGLHSPSRGPTGGLPLPVLVPSCSGPSLAPAGPSPAPASCSSLQATSLRAHPLRLQGSRGRSGGWDGRVVCPDVALEPAGVPVSVRSATEPSSATPYTRERLEGVQGVGDHGGSERPWQRTAPGAPPPCPSPSSTPCPRPCPLPCAWPWLWPLVLGWLGGVPRAEGVQGAEGDVARAQVYGCGAEAHEEEHALRGRDAQERQRIVPPAFLFPLPLLPVLLLPLSRLPSPCSPSPSPLATPPLAGPKRDAPVVPSPGGGTRADA